MKVSKSKLMITVISALGGLLLYRVAMQFEDMLVGISNRHPGMGLGGWLLFGLWCTSGAALGVVGDRLWGQKKLLLQGDVPFAAVFLYMTVSTFIYFHFYMRVGA